MEKSSVSIRQVAVILDYHHKVQHEESEPKLAGSRSGCPGLRSQSPGRGRVLPHGAGSATEMGDWFHTGGFIKSVNIFKTRRVRFLIVKRGTNNRKE